MEHYFNVLIESAWSASIIPASYETTFFAMKSFGTFNMPLAAAIAVTGATLGMIFNWIVGRELLKLHKKRPMHISAYWYEKTAHIFNKYLVFVLLFSWAPVFKMFLVIAGFLNTKLSFVLPLVIIGQIGYYSYALL